MMKKRIIRHNFNMVEVMLAVIVVSVGIASTFVLFPVGLNASKDAAAEHRIADISEVALALIQSDILPNIVVNNKEKGYRFDSSKTGAYFCSPPTSSDKTAIDLPDVLEKLDSFTNKGNNLYYADKGLYVYAVGIGGATDFAAAIKIYLDRKDNSASGFEGEYFCTTDSKPKTYDDIKSTVGNSLNHYLLPVAVEISWPVTVPYSEREKRTFRFEMFNNEYDPKEDKDAQKS